jgi:hypothetical protein
MTLPKTLKGLEWIPLLFMLSGKAGYIGLDTLSDCMEKFPEN